MPAQATALAGFVLAGNTLLQPVVNWINRRPIDADITEAEYRVHVVCCQEHVSAVRDLLDAERDRVNYPIREVETLSSSDEQVELAATLVPSSAEAREFDAVVEALKHSPHVRSATWSVETTALQA